MNIGRQNVIFVNLIEFQDPFKEHTKKSELYIHNWLST